MQTMTEQQIANGPEPSYGTLRSTKCNGWGTTAAGWLEWAEYLRRRGPQK